MNSPSHDQLMSMLAESEAVKNAIIANATDGIICIDSRGIIQSFNRAAELLLLFSSEEVVGKNVSMLMPSPYEEEHNQYLAQYLSTRKARIIGKGREVIARRKDGTTFPIFLTVSREVVIGDQIVFIGMIRDLTREKSVEAQLRQSQKMESMGTLAGGIAHDFNNILGGITCYVELLLEDAEDGSYLNEDLKEILNGCNRAKDLVQQILTFSRQDKPKREPLYLHPIIKESLKLMRVTIPATIEIRADVATECSAVVADVTQIHQVMINLCANGHYAMRENGGILSVRLEEIILDEAHQEPGMQLPYGGYLKLTVSDTGIGMSEDVRSRVFEPFFTTKAVGEGTGMGLSVVHGIVTNHGGDIAVDSVLGEGTCFRILLPIYEEAAKSPAIEEDSRMGKGEHLILVDDDVFLLKAQTRMLKNLGYRVSAFRKSAEAMAIFRSQPDDFDLLITDQTMPGMTGTQLAEEILKIDRAFPIVLTTGFSEMLTPERAKAVGIREYMMKPVKKRALAEVLRTILEK